MFLSVNLEVELNPFSVYKKVCKITKTNNNKKSTTTTVQLAYSTSMLFIIKHSMLLIKTLFTIMLPVGKPGHCGGESNRKHQGEKKKSRIRAKNTKQHFISDVRKQQHQYNVNIKRAAKKVKINSWSIANEFSSWVTIQKKAGQSSRTMGCDTLITPGWHEYLWHLLAWSLLYSRINM